jgi:hypothetical protein
MQIVPRLSAILNRCDAACYQTWGLEAWPLIETEKWSRLGRLECDLRQWSGTRAFVQLRRAEKHTLHSDSNHTILSLAAYSEHGKSTETTGEYALEVSSTAVYCYAHFVRRRLIVMEH